MSDASKKDDLGLKKRIAYVAIIDERGEHRIGIAEEGEPGYYRLKDDSDLGGTYRSREEAQATVDAANERLGISPQEASAIALSSMFSRRQ